MLESVLEAVKTRKWVDDPMDEKLISVQLYGKGAIQRTISYEKAPKPFMGFVGRKGQIVYSRIWARKGAIAKITEELDGVVVTNEFPLFDVSPSVDVDYLLWYFRTSSFASQLELAGTGTSGQNRIKEKEFLKLSVPLPPLTEQKRITAILSEVAESIQKTQNQLEQAESLKEHKYRSLTKSPRSLKSLSELGVKKVAGKSIVAKLDDEHELNRVIKVSSVSSGVFIASESKPLPSYYQPNDLHRVSKGDLLFARASGSANLLGACCIVTEDVEFLYLPDKVWRLEVDERVIPKSYLLQALKSREFRAIAESQFSSSTGVKNIKSSVLMNFKIPVLEKEDFQQFSETIADVNFLIQKFGQKLALLQELQRSLSARAFDGRL